MEIEKSRIFILIMSIIIVILIGFVFAMGLRGGQSINTAEFDQWPGYEQLLNNVIEEKNEEIRLEKETISEGGDYFIVTKEMEEDPRYHNHDGSLT